MINTKEFFDGLSQEDKNEILNSIFLEQLDEVNIMQFLFFKCAKICVETNADNLELKSDLLKINKKGVLKFELQELI